MFVGHSSQAQYDELKDGCADPHLLHGLNHRRVILVHPVWDVELRERVGDPGVGKQHLRG